ncbi:carbohydrate ABC transporter permease [Roseibium sp.]|uniref:carbohydrate ABC transporter permease n=1 Tax=Roseibium sp. TaxID=1936156 RepID=UPI003B50D3A2
MIENSRSINRAAIAVLAIGCVFILMPLVFVLVTATQTYGHFLREGFSLWPGTNLIENIRTVWEVTSLPQQLWNSLVVAVGVTLGKIFLAFTTSFAVVFFRARYGALVYAAILVSIMLPLDLMVITAYQVSANVALPVNAVANARGLWAAVFGQPLELKVSILDSYAGIILPLLSTGAGTLILVQFMRTLPVDLARAATMDGAGPLRFMWDVILPLSKRPMVALLIYFFIGAWGQFLWPLVAASTPDLHTAVVGLTRLDVGGEEEQIPNFPLRMTGAIVVSIVPLVMIAIFQRRIVSGLTYSDR